MEELQEEQQEEYGEPDKPEAAAEAAAAGSDTPAAAAAAAAAAPSSTSGQQDEQQPAASSSSKSTQQQQQQQQEADGPDLDFEAGEMSYWERRLLTASVQLLQASTAVVKAFGRALLQGPALAAGTDSLDGWESCLWHTKHLTRAVEDLGASMYPPQVRPVDKHSASKHHRVLAVASKGTSHVQGPALAAGTDSLDRWESCLWHTKHLTRAVDDLGASMYPPQVRSKSN